MIASRALCVATVVMFARVGAVFAQAPDFSGTWKLDSDRSRVTAEVAFAGLIGAGAPDRLHITHAQNGTVVIESEANPSHARIYKPGGETSTTVPQGQVGSITMTSRWADDTLVSEGRWESKTDTASAAFEVKEVLGVGADGALEIEITTAGADGKNTSTLVYTRTSDVGPCATWVSPCKPPSP